MSSVTGHLPCLYCCLFYTITGLVSYPTEFGIVHCRAFPDWPLPLSSKHPLSSLSVPYSSLVLITERHLRVYIDQDLFIPSPIESILVISSFRCSWEKCLWVAFFVWAHVFRSVRETPGNAEDLCSGTMFCFGSSHQIVFQCGYAVPHSHQHWKSLLLLILANTWYYQYLDFSHPSERIALSCYSSVQLRIDLRHQVSSRKPVCHLNVSYREVSMQLSFLPSFLFSLTEMLCVLINNSPTAIYTIPSLIAWIGQLHTSPAHATVQSLSFCTDVRLSA